jgi:hypothetical protein
MRVISDAVWVFAEGAETCYVSRADGSGCEVCYLVITEWVKQINVHLFPVAVYDIV